MFIHTRGAPTGRHAASLLLCKVLNTEASNPLFTSTNVYMVHACAEAMFRPPALYVFINLSGECLLGGFKHDYRSFLIGHISNLLYIK